MGLTPSPSALLRSTPVFGLMPVLYAGAATACCMEAQVQVIVRTMHELLYVVPKPTPLKREAGCVEQHAFTARVICPTQELAFGRQQDAQEAFKRSKPQA
jgi:hypothetical protein